MQTTTYLLILAIATVISFMISIFSWNRRPAAAAMPLAILMFCVFQWLLCQTLQDFSTNLFIKAFWYNLKFFGITTVPISWLILTLKYSRNEKFITARYMIIYTVIPFISNILLWTNKFHHLFYKEMNFETINSLPVVITQEGLWFWVHTYYSYLLLLSGIILIVLSFVRLPESFRKQTAILLIGVSIPLFSNMLTVFKLIKTPYSDITPFALLLTGILFFWSLFRYKFFDLIPIARHAVFESMKDIIFVLDNQKRIVDANPTALRVIGRKGSDIIGKQAVDIFAKYHIIEKFEDSFTVNEKVMFEGNGSKSYYDLSILPINDKKNKLTGRLIILRNITDLEEAIEALEESKQIAESASKAKSQFLATMSHEIRTPMNAIIGMSELLAATELHHDQKEYLEIIQLSADSLLTIINDILDFSKIEAGKLDLERIDFDLKDLIDNVVKTLSSQAVKKNLSLLCHFEENIPHMLVGDPVRLKQILINLVSNSIKFTNEGKVDVKLENVKHNDDFISIRFSVLDTGIGISEEKTVNLFQVFNQLDNSTTRKFGGTGLGLSIVKSLVELMGGTIEVKSKVGEGSIFSFIMDFQISNLSSSQAYEEAAASSGSDHKDINLLIAEDNKVNQMLILKMIEKQGWHADIADNGKIVLDKISASDNYDIVLMDIQMPEMDGLEASQAIRNNELITGKHIPIIALTANAMKEDREACIDAGMDDYLSKPIKSSKLYEMIEKYVK